ncbi:hypothetical protein HN662_03585 [Candidatus Woesearchaeota archaeon]|jgi:hypothetical protein|nr:hypothetical protein [Candidatus Woesearchaeota archaeon]
MSIDDCCEGECGLTNSDKYLPLKSHGDVERDLEDALNPPVSVIYRKDVERDLDEALKPTWQLKYNIFIANLQEKHPAVYKVMRKIGFTYR